MASLALEDIWDAPIVPSPPPSPQRTSPVADDEDHDVIAARPPKRPHSTLFLDSDSDEAPKQPARYASRAAPGHPDIDALFDDLDEPDQGFQDLAPSLDLDALRREADARNAKAHPLDLDNLENNPADGSDGSGAENAGTIGKKGKGGLKERKKPSRLDEARLLGQNGLQALVKQAKHFKPKGKGHEATDLNRLLQVYQFWTHKMYPKNQFRESVQRVEKLCHSRRMHVSLSVWRDESKGLINGHKRPTDSASDGDNDEDGSDDDAAKAPSANDALDEEHIPSSRAPSRPPSSASENTSMDGPDDFDMDAIIREDEQRQTTAAAPPPPPPPSAPNQAPPATNTADDDDEAMWDQLMGGLPDDPVPPLDPGRGNVARPAQPRDEDEDMWDIVREMEAAPPAAHSSGDTQQAASTSAASAGTDPAISPAPAHAGDDDGWDEMYM